MANDSMNDLAEPDNAWAAHDAKVTSTSFGTMALRLPAICREVVALSWRASRADTIVTVAGSIAAELLTVLGLFATVDVLGQLFAEQPTPERLRAMVPALARLVIVLLMRSALREATRWSRERLGPLVDREINLNLVGLTSAVDLVMFDDPDFHDELRRVNQTAANQATILIWSVAEAFAGLVGLIAIAGALGVLHPILLPLILLAAVPGALAAVRASRIGYQLFASTIAADRRREALKDILTERRSAAEVRAYTMRDYLLSGFRTITDRITGIRLRAERRQQLASVVGDALGGLATGGVYLVLLLLVAQDSISLAIAGTAAIAVRQARDATDRLLRTVTHSYEGGLYLEDYLRFCALARDRAPREGGQDPGDFVDQISAHELRFTYPSGTSPALDGVSIEIQPNEIVALVGENGSGKSTLAKLIGGLYAPDSGTLTWGGVDQHTVDGHALRSRIATVAQDFTHWPLTVEQNITVGRHDHHEPDKQLRWALTASGADDVVDRLPNGLNTMLDPSYKGGVELSGGQWQRIAVARGFYRDAQLLICDEPTAAVDARTEYAIFDSIRQHAAQRTVLMITHRLASVRWADRIYVLHEGRVVESGTHAELIKQRGKYAELYLLQAQAYDQNSPS